MGVGPRQRKVIPISDRREDFHAMDERKLHPRFAIKGLVGKPPAPDLKLQFMKGRPQELPPGIEDGCTVRGLEPLRLDLQPEP